MLSQLPEDLLFEISNYLDIIDTITFEKSLRIQPSFFLPYALKIQSWYKKYKEARDVRYKVIYDEYQLRNKLLYDAYYAQIFFGLYNIRKLRKRIKEYHFYLLIDYYYRSDPDEMDRIISLLSITLENPSYSNLKQFARELKIELIMRL